MKRTGGCWPQCEQQSERLLCRNRLKRKKYYVVRERAVPEVLLKVVEAKRLLESKRVATVQEAAERTGISRSSFYKYKDDIFPFHEETKGRPSPLSFRWMMSREFYPMFFGLLQKTMQYSDHTSEYSHQWYCHSYLKCADPSGRRGC